MPKPGAAPQSLRELANPDHLAMRIDVGRYLANTLHLNAAGHGALMLLVLQYRASGPLPDDDAALATLARTDIKAWSSGLGVAVRAFFERDREGRLHPGKCLRAASTG